MAGGTVTERAARRWNGGRATRPHCGQAEETAEHGFWERPRRGRSWAQALGGGGRRAPRRRPLANTAVAGLPP
eukprot:11226059-Lingulodinium_polyedra.AAC.1